MATRTQTSHVHTESLDVILVGWQFGVIQGLTIQQADEQDLISTVGSRDVTALQLLEFPQVCCDVPSTVHLTLAENVFSGILQHPLLCIL